MEDKKFLRVTGKRVEKNGNIVAEATAVVPYIKDGAAKLPDVAPFNTNVWLAGDDGRVLKQIPGKPVYSATLVKYADLICARPNGQGMISGITEA